MLLFILVLRSYVAAMPYEAAADTAAVPVTIDSGSLPQEGIPARGFKSFDHGIYPSASGDYFRGRQPARVHSHNDYWHAVPLGTALDYGCTSIEADVWLFNGKLYIGHDAASLQEDRTFQSLYIQPLLAVLQQKNPSNAFTKYFQQDTSQGYYNGVFSTASTVSLQLLVDVKTDANTTWQRVVEELGPLRDNGFLSYVKAGDKSINSRPVTVVGTGSTPAQYFQANPARDVFFDAKLGALTDKDTSTISPVASTSFAQSIGWDGLHNMTAQQRNKTQQYLDDARSKGIKSRFWDCPTWPPSARDRVWRTLLDMGVDYLNADDLAAATAL